MDKQKLIERIALLKKQRDQFVADANRAVGEFNGRIAELELLLEEDKESVEPLPHTD